jgi:lipopolysaccharide export system permease protein
MGAFLPIYKRDTTSTPKTATLARIDSIERAKDSIAFANIPITGKLDPNVNVAGLYGKMQTLQLFNSAQNSVNNILNSIGGKKEELGKRYKIYNLHVLSLHKKFALALSCIILFFVGAPLGAIIRKGGLGLPMVVAIILFLTYYFLGVFAGNYAKEGNIHPILGAWLPTIIMLPLGIFLTKRATADKGLMSFGNVMDFIKDLFKRKKRESNSY